MKILLKITSVLLLCFSALSLAAQEAQPDKATAIFAGGCFWCMEPPFDKLEGVSATVSGYSGGTVKNPDYKTISRGTSGHYEVIRVSYDPSKVSYEQLLDVFWVNIDPTDASGQFCDKGPQYRSGIFYADEQQKAAAELSLRKLRESGKLRAEIVTEVLPAKTFYRAERYHQNYYLRNPIRYKYYRTGCGRDRRLFELWGEAAAK